MERVGRWGLLLLVGLCLGSCGGGASNSDGDAATSEPVCGDQACEGDETCDTCAADCGPCEACGDGACGAPESTASCPQDCPPDGPVCGDGACAAGETATTCASDCGLAWTVLVYTTADNDLEPFALLDLEEMAAASWGGRVEFLVQVDRSVEESASGVLGQPNWTDTRRFRVRPGSLELLDVIGEVNMGAPESLADFVAWGISTAPAEKIALVLWDHGGGWDAFGPDASHGFDPLDLAELTSGLRAGLLAAGRSKVDLLGFDACLMATVETAHQLRSFADVLVASQETEPGVGWDYRAIGEALRGQPAMPASMLARRIVDSYRAHVAELVSSANELSTLTAVDLTRIEDVAAGADALARALADLLSSPGGFELVAGARFASQEFGGGEGAKHLRDLLDLATRANIVSGGALSAELALVSTAIEDAVIYESHGAAKSGAMGLSIYFAPEAAIFDDAYLATDFAAATYWDELLALYFVAEGADTTPPTIGPISLAGPTYSASVSTSLLRQKVLLVTRATAEGDQVVALLPAHVASGLIQADWEDALFGLSTGTEAIEAPPIFVDSWIAPGGAAQYLYELPATYRPPVGAAQHVSLRYVWDSGAGIASFAGAYGETSGAVAEVDLVAGGTLTSAPLFFETGGLAWRDDLASGSLGLGAGAPELAAFAAPQGDYLVGFLIEDYAGNGASSFASVWVPCASDDQCTASGVGDVCDVATGECVECTEASALACGPGGSCGPSNTCCSYTWEPLLANGDFEAASAGWTEAPGGLILHASALPYLPYSGSYASWLGGVDGGSDTLYRSASVPTDALALRFDARAVITTDEAPGPAYDTLGVWVADPGWTTFDPLVGMSNVDADPTLWQVLEGTASSAHAGESVVLIAQSQLDASQPTSFFLDDLRLDALVCR